MAEETTTVETTEETVAEVAEEAAQTTEEVVEETVAEATEEAVAEEVAEEATEEKEKKPNIFQKAIAWVKNFFKGIKDSNPYFKKTMARINNKNAMYGAVNRRVKDGDFHPTSYVSIFDGKGVIYGSAQEDYVFTGADVVSMELEGRNVKFNLGSTEMLATCCIITFADGKKAYADIISDRLANFKRILGINL